ncbi:LuxR C-terminal-related transcriptional regulator [Phytohabitans sp. LJ34]|uniref:helix-turn-helix transcriptional regulator n=1 Tax=Phytohabitans sp. LJ34 TaxID=3452217 RepID=UPI003F89B9C3
MGGSKVLGPPAPSLVRYGSSVDADLVYRCLLTLGARTAVRLEHDLGLPPSRVAAAIEELASLGVVGGRRRPDRTETVWTAGKPDDVISALRQHRRRSTPARQRSRGAGAAPVPLGDGLRHLPSRAMTRERLAELNGVVRHEHLAMQPDREFDAESARSAVPLDRTLLSRGVRMRVLGVQPVDADPLVAHGRSSGDERPDYRQAIDVPTKLIVLDRRVAFMPVTADNLDHGYLEVTDGSVVAALVELFERHWSMAVPGQEQRMARLSLSTREQDLIALLVSGHTDASAAAVLRVSRRTVSNLLRGLMDRLGVENRFQLGVAIGALGVATSPAASTTTTEGDIR